MIEQATEKLRGILDRMRLDAEVVASEDAEHVTLEVRGAESALVIGKHGATLDALQYLVNRMVSSGGELPPKLLVVDAEGYRQRRAEQLTELAHRLADKARKGGRPVAASPMSAADRRIMHMALANATDVSTRSEGEGPARHLVVVPGPRPAGAPTPSDEG
jgi:spoIIIJ-associated protein